MFLQYPRIISFLIRPLCTGSCTYSRHVHSTPHSLNGFRDLDDDYRFERSEELPVTVRIRSIDSFRYRFTSWWVFTFPYYPPYFTYLAIDFERPWKRGCKNIRMQATNGELTALTVDWLGVALFSYIPIMLILWLLTW